MLIPLEAEGRTGLGIERAGFRSQESEEQVSGVRIQESEVRSQESE